MSNELWTPPQWPRFTFLLFAGVSIITGLVAAVVLLGFFTESPAARLSVDHGPLMVFGFVGGAIGLERAVAVRTRWAWAGPALNALGVITTLAGVPKALPAALFAGSFLVLGMTYATVHRRQPTLFVVVQAVGVIGGVAAAVVWGTGAAFAYAMPFGVVFAVATIIGERLELARITIAGTRDESIISALVLGLTAASLVFLVDTQLGFIIMGAVLIAIAVITARVDIARNLVKSKALPRYSSVCMMLGYMWLTIGGAIWIIFGHYETGFTYDAGVHAVFLGFVMSMIFAHAPIILTGVIRHSLPYHPVMYVAVGLLHAGLAVRLMGDFREANVVWQTGGIINVVAIVVFLLTSFTLTVRHAAKKAAKGTQKTAGKTAREEVRSGA